MYDYIDHGTDAECYFIFSGTDMESCDSSALEAMEVGAPVSEGGTGSLVAGARVVGIASDPSAIDGADIDAGVDLTFDANTAEMDFVSGFDGYDGNSCGF